MRMVVNDYEDGFDDVSPERIAVVKVQLNRGTEDWQGWHQEPATRTEETPAGDDYRGRPRVSPGVQLIRGGVHEYPRRAER